MLAFQVIEICKDQPKADRNIKATKHIHAMNKSTKEITRTRCFQPVEVKKETPQNTFKIKKLVNELIDGIPVEGKSCCKSSTTDILPVPVLNVNNNGTENTLKEKEHLVTDSSIQFNGKCDDQRLLQYGNDTDQVQNFKILKMLSDSVDEKDKSSERKTSDRFLQSKNDADAVQTQNFKMLKILSDSAGDKFSDLDFLPDQNNNADRPQCDGRRTPPKLKSMEGIKSELSPLLSDAALKITSPPPKFSLSNDVENERLSLSGLIRILTTEVEILELKHIKDLEFVWNSVKPDKKEGKQSVAIETVVKEEFYKIVGNCLKLLKNIDLEKKEVYTGWQQVKLILNIAWILSDSSLLFCEQLVVNSQILKHFCFMMNAIVSCDQFEEDKNLKYTIKAFLGILHNICRHNSNSRECLRNCALLSVMLRLSKTKIAMIRAKCLIVMSYIVNDSEIHIVSTDSKVLIFIIDILKNAENSSDHMSYKFGMNVSEILQGLNNLLANDENKEKLMSLDILTVYLEILTAKFSEEEICQAVNGVWKLSFHQSNKERMKSNKQLVEVLNELQLSDVEDVKHAARGALWEINQHIEGSNLNTNSVHLEVECPHIMISYQWDSQPVMLKVKDRLKQAGYKVWMDVEHMTGSTLEAMALAVERSVVILIGMSQKYKDSPSCRSEAEYTYKLRKSFIPLRLQHRYVPDGWLGMLIGTRLYFDISNEDKIDQQMDNIMKELGTRGKIVIPGDDVDGCLSPKASSIVPQRLRYEDWSTQDVSEWLSSNSINNIPVKIRKEIDGPLLKELVTVQNRAPEHFYKLVQTDFRLDVIDMLKFSKMLRGLNS